MQETQNVFPAIRSRIEQAIEKLESELVSHVCAPDKRVVLTGNRKTVRSLMATQRKSRRQKKLLRQERRSLPKHHKISEIGYEV